MLSSKNLKVSHQVYFVFALIIFKEGNIRWDIKDGFKRTR